MLSARIDKYNVLRVLYICDTVPLFICVFLRLILIPCSNAQGILDRYRLVAFFTYTKRYRLVKWYR